MHPLYILYDMWPVLLLRFALGAIFIVHGWPKVRNLKQTAQNFGGMGFKPGAFFGPLVALLEFFGGIALVLGLFTKLFSAFFVAEFIVIIVWRLIRKSPFVGGWELDLLILAGVIALFSLGGGMYALDRTLFGIL